MTTSSSATTTLTSLKGFAIATSFFSSGGIAIISLMGMPALLHGCSLASHNVAAKQFALIWRIGAITQPPSTLLTTFTYGAVAWYYKNAGNAVWKSWAVAGIC